MIGIGPVQFPQVLTSTSHVPTQPVLRWQFQHPLSVGANPVEWAWQILQGTLASWVVPPPPVRYRALAVTGSCVRVWQAWHTPVESPFAYEPVLDAAPPVLANPVVFVKKTALGGGLVLPIAGGVIAFGTSLMLVVPCGVWQSRQVVLQLPYCDPVFSELCGTTAWQSLQSWLALSRTSRVPSPPFVLTEIPTGREYVVPPALVARTRSVYPPVAGMEIVPPQTPD